jgi:hypothetical protein
VRRHIGGCLVLDDASPLERRQNGFAFRLPCFWLHSLWVLPSRAQTSLDEAYHVIASKTFVDLTHTFGPDTPVWSGFGQARMRPASDPKTHKPYTIEKEGFRPGAARRLRGAPNRHVQGF